MQWSGLGEGRAAVVGYNSEGGFFQNHPASGFSTIADAISCGVNPGRRRKRQAVGIDPMAPTPLPVDDNTRDAVAECNNRYNLDIWVFQVVPDELVELLSGCPCPPTLDQAISDAARFVEQSRSPLCYVSTMPNCKGTPGANGAVQVTAAQQCCYGDNG